MCQRAEAGMYDADGHIAEVATSGNGKVLVRITVGTTIKITEIFIVLLRQ